MKIKSRNSRHRMQLTLSQSVWDTYQRVSRLAKTLKVKIDISDDLEPVLQSSLQAALAELELMVKGGGRNAN